MTRTLPLALIVLPLLACSALSAKTRENQRLEEGKITKIEAQHLVLKKFPHATIKSCNLVGETGSGVWVVRFNQAGSQEISQIRVNGRSGKFVQ